MSYADHFALIAKDLRAEHHRLDAHLARTESTTERIIAAEAAEVAAAALTGLRKVAQRLDADVAIAEHRKAI